MVIPKVRAVCIILSTVFSGMRVLIVLVFLSVVFISLDALCIHIKISNTFNYQFTSGNPQGARIGIDEVVHTATIWGEIEISGNQFF